MSTELQKKLGRIPRISYMDNVLKWQLVYVILSFIKN